jgi:hypothetical protein
MAHLLMDKNGPKQLLSRHQWDSGAEVRLHQVFPNLFPKFRAMLAHLMLPSSSPASGSTAPRLNSMPFPSQLAAVEFLRACIGFEAHVELTPIDSDGPALRKYFVSVWRTDEEAGATRSLATYSSFLHDAVVTCSLSMADGE